ncbi:MAG: DUF3991 domain-containing protein, partial [Dysgonamonadaceae bacterium]|nr:DUF3991 domain-containing protein [Dysgonamonadaceae bacterium]
MVTFNEYRSKVSILQIAEHLGYLPVKGKSTKARPVLRDAAGDTIIIKHPEMPSMQLYWNLGNSSEHGSVIDFVKNNVNRFSCAGRNEIDNINKILAHFSGIDYDNAKYMNQPVASQKIFNESDYNAVIPDIGMLHFLTGERKISEETIKAFLPFIRIVENNGYKNVGFPFTVADRDDKVRGYELRNYGGFKSFSAGGDKVNAAWIADFSVNRSEINQIFFFESAIDALSFCELKSMSFDLHKSVFVSSGGFPCAEQFRHVMNAYPDTAMLIGCHDNDLHGHLYDITLACVKSNQSFARNKLDDAVEF